MENYETQVKEIIAKLRLLKKIDKELLDEGIEIGRKYREERAKLDAGYYKNIALNDKAKEENKEFEKSYKNEILRFMEDSGVKNYTYEEYEFSIRKFLNAKVVENV